MPISHAPAVSLQECSSLALPSQAHLPLLKKIARFINIHCFAARRSASFNFNECQIIAHDTAAIRFFTDHFFADSNAFFKSGNGGGGAFAVFGGGCRPPGFRFPARGRQFCKTVAIPKIPAKISAAAATIRISRRFLFILV